MLPPREVAVDLILRWCAEALLAVGMSQEHALLLAGALIANLRPKSSDEAFASFQAALEAMANQTLPAVPDYEVETLSDTAVRLHGIDGHDVFALHAAAEFCLQSAATSGWGSALVDLQFHPAWVLGYLEQVARQGMTCAAIRAAPSSSGTGVAMTVTLGGAGTDGRGELVDIPAKTLSGVGSKEMNLSSLGSVLRDAGCSMELHGAFEQDCATGVQMIAVDPQFSPRDSELILLRRIDLASVFPEFSYHRTPATVSVSPSACKMIRAWCARLHVFDPLA